MTPEVSTLAFEEDFSLSPARIQKIDRAIARYPIVAEEIGEAPRESVLFRLRTTWLGDFCYEIPGVLRSMFWGVRIAVRMTGRKG